MGKKITWAEMKKQYPGEWLMIEDYDLDASGHLEKGIVTHHSNSKTALYNSLTRSRTVAFRYTGESDFQGLRSHGSN